MYVFSVPTHAFNHCIASRKTWWFHHGNKYSAAACSVWQPVDLLGGTTRVGSLCLVFHPASQSPPHQPIKWRIVKETFLECLTHYSLTLSPFPSPWFMQASQLTSWVRTRPSQCEPVITSRCVKQTVPPLRPACIAHTFDYTQNLRSPFPAAPSFALQTSAGLQQQQKKKKKKTSKAAENLQTNQYSVARVSALNRESLSSPAPPLCP